MATGYANRGFMRNNLHQAKQAVQDFQTAIKFRQDYGEAHFGLAYSYLQLAPSAPALEQFSIAKNYWPLPGRGIWRGPSLPAGTKASFAEKEYRIALDECRTI